MDDDLIALPVDQDDELEEVASCIRAEDQPAIRVFTEVVDLQRVLDRMEHVFVGDIVATDRVENLHTELPYYEIASACRQRTK